MYQKFLSPINENKSHGEEHHSQIMKIFDEFKIEYNNFIQNKQINKNVLDKIEKECNELLIKFTKNLIIVRIITFIWIIKFQYDGYYNGICLCVHIIKNFNTLYPIDVEEKIIHISKIIELINILNEITLINNSNNINDIFRNVNIQYNNINFNKYIENYQKLKITLQDLHKQCQNTLHINYNLSEKTNQIIDNIIYKLTSIQTKINNNNNNNNNNDNTQTKITNNNNNDNNNINNNVQNYHIKDNIRQIIKICYKNKSISLGISLQFIIDNLSEKEEENIINSMRHEYINSFLKIVINFYKKI
ncbi:hypothetical protein AB837_00172 [bacterium AB1]|nr:hypothetical protein AB837_00172 [bacterium AB1]